MELNTKGGFEELVKIPISKIVEDTHIRADNVRAILNKEFGNIHAVKARGFISILEREYKLDLDEWIREYMDYRREVNTPSQEGYFVVANQTEEEQKVKAKKWGIAILGLFVVAIVGYGLSTLSSSMILSSDSNTDVPLFEVNESNETNDSNETNETNSSEIVQPLEINATENNQTVVDHNSTLLSLNGGTFTPKKKIWVGLRDLSDKSFKGITGTEPFAIDGTKEYALQAGHGEFTIQLKGKTFEPSTRGFTRLHIVNGLITELTKEEFIALEKKK